MTPILTTLINALVSLGTTATQRLLTAAKSIPPAPMPVITSGTDYIRGRTDEQRQHQLNSAMERMTGDARRVLGPVPEPIGTELLATDNQKGPGT